MVLLAPEAKNPARDVPRALFGSLLGVTVVCAMASVALSGAEAAPDLDADSAFAEAFRRRGLTMAYKVLHPRDWGWLDVGTSLVASFAPDRLETRLPEQEHPTPFCGMGCVLGVHYPG